jgi:hypothetical protein
MMATQTTNSSSQRKGWVDGGITSSSVMGITSINASMDGSHTCLIGTDTGAVVSCSFKDFKDVRSLLMGNTSIQIHSL